MTIKDINAEQLRKHLNQLGHITVLNGAMYKNHLVGYIRKITGDHFMFEDNETGECFIQPLPATFKKISTKHSIESK